MKFRALVCDYDGTLATDGSIRADTVQALSRARDSGRRLVLATGRTLPDLRCVCPEHGIFDRLVVENGAVVFAPKSRATRCLGEPPSRVLLRRLSELGVAPLQAGRVIVATTQLHDQAVEQAIRGLGLAVYTTRNRGTVMILPVGVDKATGVRVALASLGLGPHQAVALGDAENDQALLGACELGIAVSNAVPSLKEAADWVTRGADGRGVSEVVELLLNSDLKAVTRRIRGDASRKR